MSVPNATTVVDFLVRELGFDAFHAEPQSYQNKSWTAYLNGFFKVQDGQRGGVSISPDRGAWYNALREEDPTGISKYREVARIATALQERFGREGVCTVNIDDRNWLNIWVSAPRNAGAAASATPLDTYIQRLMEAGVEESVFNEILEADFSDAVKAAKLRVLLSKAPAPEQSADESPM